MKKILCFMMFVLLLVSCSKDSGGDVGYTNNYIEINGERYQVDAFVISGWNFAIGSDKDDVYIGLMYDNDHEPVFNKKVYIKDDLPNIRRYAISGITDYPEIEKWYTESYYYIGKKDNDNYHVEVYIKAKNLNLIVKYDGKIMDI